MKNIKQNLFFAVVIAFAMSSCTVQKRLHNPGYHVQLNKNIKIAKAPDKIIKADEQIAFTEVETDETNLPILAEQAKVSTEIASANRVETNYGSDLASNDESLAFQNSNSPKRSSIQAKNTVENQPVVAKQQVKKAKNDTASKVKSANNTGGLALLILIILCFFPLINLIPVYITDGGITLNFWVTLLLNLTVIGAVIFSLLVVLGIVSLA